MTNWTVQQASEAARQRFPDPASALLEAHLLLGRVLGMERSMLLAHPERRLSADEAARFFALAERRAAGEPLAYILGERAFYDGVLRVTPDVLIPRPETELLVEQALAYTAGRALVAADIGTGSGAIAISYARHAPQALVYATDISPQALEVAQSNAAGLPIYFLHGDLGAPLIELGVQVDVVMANLPYLTTRECDELDVGRYEPRLALDGGRDGLEVVRRLLAQTPRLCAPRAALFLEIGAGQGDAALDLAFLLRPHAAHLVQDLAGRDRLLVIML
ncbi:MAG: peptide chain release factor N(5)-glutamine methyltransferase [Anaerolineae bacterium]|nr:peptide chain release factor N(5)-glutamine methyltransferase [Anaerolineae bacterium]MDW8171268.1 peptide chain release factor N(5)-glutamine methyltransferase [Anaerolineae bacterium]